MMIPADCLELVLLSARLGVYVRQHTRQLPTSKTINWCQNHDRVPDAEPENDSMVVKITLNTEVGSVGAERLVGGFENAMKKSRNDEAMRSWDMMVAKRCRVKRLGEVGWGTWDMIVAKRTVPASCSTTQYSSSISFSQ
eukprot:3156903-Rhodomonas_salina.3